MKPPIRRRFRRTMLLAVLCLFGAAALQAVKDNAGEKPDMRVERGARLYLNGIRSDGSPLLGVVHGNMPLPGKQAVCADCHRISAMGSSEGTAVVPALRGKILFEPLRLPTRKPPLAPIQRPAYTAESLAEAIRDGVGASGKRLNPLMPRYALSDEEIGDLTAYLKSLNMAPAPGVTDTEIHLATVVGASTPPEIRRALLDVFDAFFAQKNGGSRHESERAKRAPWHKAWLYGSHREWVLHVWELEGPESSWDEQLERQYREHPVFALIGGTAQGDWRPVHEFCQRTQLPCVFPITALPVDAEHDRYSVYLDKGMPLQGEILAEEFAGNRKPLIQVYAETDPLGRTAAASLRAGLERGKKLQDVAIETDENWPQIIAKRDGATAVLWLGQAASADLWKTLTGVRGPRRIYLSATLFGEGFKGIPERVRDRIHFVLPYELPARRPRSLARASRWLRAKKIYAPGEEGIQADSYLALTMTAMALKRVRGYFIREYFLESLEHMVDNTTFTSRYPRISLAPGQRFAAKGVYIVKLSDSDRNGLSPVTVWRIPDTR